MAQMLGESATVVEVCEGSMQGRQVWAGGRQAFPEYPHEMVGGRLGHGSGAWLQAWAGHRECQAVEESIPGSAPSFLPAHPLRLLAPDLCSSSSPT